MAAAHEVLASQRESARVAAFLAAAAPEDVAAIAATLVEQPTLLHTDLIQPLTNAVLRSDGSSRAAIVAAVAAAPEDWTTPTLRGWLESGHESLEFVAACEVIAASHRRGHVALLISEIEKARNGARQVLLETLAAATGLNFADDDRAAVRWWEAAEKQSEAEWQRTLLHNALTARRDAAASAVALEARMKSLLQKRYLREKEDARDSTLANYLADPLPLVRRLGLDLLQERLTSGKKPPPELLARARESLADADDRVQAAAVGAVVALRDRADEPRFLQMLADAESATLRNALLNALGYIGGTASVDVLLTQLRAGPESLTVDVLASLTRLLERGVQTPAQTAEAAALLRAAVPEIRAQRSAVYAQAIWTLGVLRDEAARPLLIAALGSDQPLVVRQAAIRALALWGDPDATKAVLALVDNRNPRLRRTVLDSAGRLVDGNGQIEAVLRMALPRYEPDDTNRAMAWRTVNQVLRDRDAAAILAAVAFLESEQSADSQIVALCTMGLEKLTGPDADVGHKRAFLLARGKAHEQSANPTAALESYIAAIGLPAGEDEPMDDRCREALRVCKLACETGRYNDDLIAMLVNAVPDADAFWTIAAEEFGFEPNEADRKIIAMMLDKPPVPISDDFASTLRERIATSTTETADATDS